MRRILIAIAAASAFAATASQAAEKISIGVQPATQPIYIAKAAGFLAPIEKKYDVTFEFENFSYGAPENQAMAAGAIQMASAGMGPAIVAAARLPAKLVAITILDQTAIIVPTGSEIKSVADLKGKKIAYPGRGSQQYPLLIKALADAGMTEDDVELFKTKGSDVGSLIASKQVDAGVTWDPHISSALADGSAEVLLTSKAILPIKDGHYIGNGFYIREDFIEAHPDIVQDVVDALVKAEKLILSEPETAIDMWEKEIGFPRKVIEYSLNQGISVYTADITPDEKAVAEYTTFLKSAEILSAEDAPKVDASFAAKAKNAE
ncbi:aliphatic sulfonates family ABC transporter substrate-binding protein [Amorphus suaedae]